MQTPEQFLHVLARALRTIPAQISIDSRLTEQGLAGCAQGEQISIAPRYAGDARVLCHEFAHVLQWRAGRIPDGLGFLHHTAIEREAAKLARALLACLCGYEPGIPRWARSALCAPPRDGLAPSLPLHEWALGKGAKGSYKLVSARTKKTEVPKQMPGWTFFWDPGLNDWVRTNGGNVGLYKNAAKEKGTQIQTRAEVLKELQALIPKMHPSVQMVLENDDLLPIIFSYFSQRELMILRGVCRNFRRIGETIIWNSLVKFRGLSSVIPAQGTKATTLKRYIVDKLAQVHNVGGTALIASDKITSGDLMSELLGPCIKFKINIGTEDKEGLANQEKWNTMQVTGPNGHGKAHAKFISGGGGVLMTSANFTPNAMSGSSEVGVHTNSLQVQAFFNRYWQLIRNSTREQEQQFTRLLNTFNRGNHPMRLALAPFVSIAPWLEAELEGSTTIVMRMFLISEINTGKDIIAGLNALARAGCKIDVYIDWGSYYAEDSKNPGNMYVQSACQALMRGTTNVTIYQQAVTAKDDSIMHDKLILAEIQDKGVTYQKVILGSAGLSTQVQRNRNYDYLVAIDEKGLYDYFMQHHLKTLAMGERYPIRKVEPIKESESL